MCALCFRKGRYYRSDHFYRKGGAPYGINVNVIPVPTTDTPGLREADFELVADEIPMIPLGRIAVPEDVANTALFLVSEAADYVTGRLLLQMAARECLYKGRKENDLAESGEKRI